MRQECAWILLNKTENCGRRCSTISGVAQGFCAYHNYRIKEGNINRVCSVCGIGVRSKLNLCMRHGVDKRKEEMNVHNKKNNAVRAEWNRLKKIK